MRGTKKWWPETGHHFSRTLGYALKLDDILRLEPFGPLGDLE